LPHHDHQSCHVKGTGTYNQLSLSCLEILTGTVSFPWKEVQVVAVVVRESDQVQHRLLLAGLSSLQVAIYIIEQFFRLLHTVTLDHHAAPQFIVSLQKLGHLQSCLQVKMVWCGGTTGGTVVKDHVIGQLFGKLQHLT